MKEMTIARKLACVSAPVEYNFLLLCHTFCNATTQFL